MKNKKPSALDRITKLEQAQGIQDNKLDIIIKNLDKFKSVFEKLNARLNAADMSIYILLERLQETGVLTIKEFERRTMVHFRMMQIFSELTEKYLKNTNITDISKMIIDKMNEFKLELDSFEFRVDQLQKIIKDEKIREEIITNVRNLLSK